MSLIPDELLSNPSESAVVLVDLQKDFLLPDGRMPVDQAAVPSLLECVDAIVAEAGIDFAGTPPAATFAGESSTVETDFSELQIEESSEQANGDVDLDLSADFAASDLASGEDEDLVIADDSNGLSTKMDLARAYLDMGDEDGARQILDEIIAEGSDELTAEAHKLLERIGS